MRIACLKFRGEIALQTMAEHCLRFTPQIAVREPDALFLEIGKCYKLYSEEQFLHRAETLLRRLNLTAAIGLGGSVEAALLKAGYGTHEHALLPVTALQELADPFARDPNASPLLGKLVEALHLLGIRTFAQFLAVPRRELASRFGAVSLLCRQKLDGEILATWRPWVPPEVITETIHYPYSNYAGGVEPLLFDAKKLLDRIFVRLRFRGLKASALAITTECEKMSTNPEPRKTHTLQFLVAQSDTKGALGVIREYFGKEFARRPLLSPLEQLTITVAGTTPGFAGQKNLFHSREERNEALASLVSQLSEAHGKGSVFQAETVEERLPELSWQKVPDVSKQASISGRIPLRPTHLTRPERIQVTHTHLYLRNKPYRLLRWSETVERISARWLEGAIERTYFQVEVEDGPLLWIYSDAADQFFLHGYYG